MRIIGPPSAPYAGVYSNATMSQEWFKDAVFTLLWDHSLAYNIDPVGVIAQAIKETGGGAYGGKVKREFYNTCGLKIRHQNLYPGITDGDNPLAHAMFPNWEVGTCAHVQHVSAYAGQAIYDMIVDPRYSYVIDKHWCENWTELGGKWAPSPSYGYEIEDIMKRLQGRTP